MTAVTNQEEVQVSFVQIVFERMQEGGLFIMSLILISGLIALFLMARSLFLVRNKTPTIDRNIILINSIGLFALVSGVFGQLLKLISTLDYMHFTEGIQPNEFAGSLKFTMLPTLFGCFIFLLTRFSTILLNALKATAKQ